MILMGIDIGTTHLKAGALDLDGQLLYSAARPNRVQARPDGVRIYDPQELWESAAGLLKQVCENLAGERIEAVGVASMAETGLLIDRRTGQPATPLLPWFEMRAAVPPDQIRRIGNPRAVVRRSGISPTFKCGLAKLLWLKEDQGLDLEGCTWLNAADYLVYRLTGQMVSDPSLAGRTGGYDLAANNWDTGLLERLGLPDDIFPQTQPAGSPAGLTRAADQPSTGLSAGILVSVCGHDHLCAAFGAGAVDPEDLFDSMGTAESLIGVFPARPLTERDADVGLSYGLHVSPGKMYWMGGLSSSGGALDWMRGILNHPALSYADMEDLLLNSPGGPGRVLFLPYLAGSGSPHTDPGMRAAFLGLKAGTTRADLLRAVLEGTAYEIELIRRAGETASGIPIRRVRAAGGGTRVPGWLQIKADVTGCEYLPASQPETTVCGAALLAGLGGGIFKSEEEALQRGCGMTGTTILSDAGRHTQYGRIFSQAYLAVQEPLRLISKILSE